MPVRRQKYGNDVQCLLEAPVHVRKILCNGKNLNVDSLCLVLGTWYLVLGDIPAAQFVSSSLAQFLEKISYFSAKAASFL